jgi:hypothetical protein
MPLKDAGIALGMTRQAAFHKARAGKFPVPTSLNGTRVRVDVAALRKLLGMKASETSITVDEPVKQLRQPAGESAPKPKSAAKKAPAKKAPAKKAAVVKTLELDPKTGATVLNVQTRAGRKAAAAAAEAPKVEPAARSRRTVTARVAKGRK